MSADLVQYVSKTTFNASAAVFAVTTISNSYTSNVTAGNLLLVAVGSMSDGISWFNPSSITDTQGNTYTLITNVGKGTNTGPALFIYAGFASASGPNTVTVGYTSQWVGFGAYNTPLSLWLGLSEWSGLPTSGTVSQGVSVNNSGNFISTLVLNLHNGITETLTVTCQDNVSSWAFLELYGGGAEHLVAFGIAMINTAAADVLGLSTGGTMTLTDQRFSTGADPGTKGYLSFYSGIEFADADTSYGYIIL